MKLKDYQVLKNFVSVPIFRDLAWPGFVWMF